MGVEFTDGNHFPLSTVKMTCIYELFVIVFSVLKGHFVKISIVHSV